PKGIASGPTRERAQKLENRDEFSAGRFRTVQKAVWIEVSLSRFQRHSSRGTTDLQRVRPPIRSGGSHLRGDRFYGEYLRCIKRPRRDSTPVNAEVSRWLDKHRSGVR